MTGTDSLAGTLTLQPGGELPNIRSTRTGWVRTMTRGRLAAELPDLLAAVLPLCGDAHRYTARAAIAAAGGALTQSRDDERVLQLDTLREQLRRIWLDWPPALRGSAVAADELAALRGCPVLRREVPPDDALAGLPAWLATQMLGQEPSQWLSAWDADPNGWLDAWSKRAGSWPAQLLAGCRAAACALVRVPQPLRVHADEAALGTIAARLQADPHFALAPRWQDAALETGPWTRLNDPRPERYDSAWLRLGARLAEVLRLSLPDEAGRSGAGWLRRGALALAPGVGLAWCEMARGLLVHRVSLEGVGDAARIAECDVLAPTEWNFHPQGPVAQLLRAMPAEEDDANVHLLAAAFDPCVPVQIERAVCAPSEDPHA
jgi:hypothetical protein